MIRPSRVSRYIWYICASCIVLCLLGNVSLLKSGFDSKSQQRDYQTGDDEVKSYNTEKRLPALVPQRGEHGVRKLLEDDGGVTSLVVGLKNYGYVDDGRYSTSDNLLGCEDIRQLHNVTYLDSGWTKAVYKGFIGSRSVAIKTVDRSGQEVTTCKQNGLPVEECYERATKKILKEISLLQGLNHENVIKVFGYCIPDKSYTGEPDTLVAMVTELGQSVDIIRLLQMWWEDRLRVAYGMAKIIHYLSVTPYGSLSMNDFRRQQFVLVNGQLKLSDVDDMGMSEPACSVNSDCDLYFYNNNLTLRTPCLLGQCKGYNEKKNIFNAGRHFTTFLLPHGAPKPLRPMIERTIDGFGNVTMTSKQLLHQMEKIVNVYQSGQYLNRSEPDNVTKGYIEHADSDLPGMFDYRCKLSLSGSGCTISVFDPREAADICNSDRECEGFVMTSQLTWTGRKITHLKSGSGKPHYSKGMRLFVKQS